MAEEVTAAMASVSLEAKRNEPPARVRHLFKTLDVDNSGTLSWEELETGFTKHFGVEKLAPHVLAKMKEAFDKVCCDSDPSLTRKTSSLSLAGAQVKVDDHLTKKVFARFYAEVLFRHFDADNSDSLQLAEMQNALGHLVKPNADGTKTLPVLAYPPEFTDEKGEVHLPVKWFWATFMAME